MWLFYFIFTKIKIIEILNVLSLDLIFKKFKLCLIFTTGDSYYLQSNQNMTTNFENILCFQNTKLFSYLLCFEFPSNKNVVYLLDKQNQKHEVFDLYVWSLNHTFGLYKTKFRVNSSKMKTTDEEPWNIIVEPPLENCKKRQKMPLEGSWKLIGNENFEAYLLAIGISPLTATMVMR
jgi:hypothetical protein